jgi:hypothetical protein
MALPDISLAQFNRIASGNYNAGQIDFKTAKDGSTELVKINNHVWQTSELLDHVQRAEDRLVRRRGDPRPGREGRRTPDGRRQFVSD